MVNKNDILKKQILDNISWLIDANKLEEAINLIEGYMIIDSQNIEIYSMYAIALILQKEFETSKKIILSGLQIDPENIDLLYNLAYIYELKDDLKSATRYYAQVYCLSKDELLKQQIINKFEVDRLKFDIDSAVSIENFLMRNSMKKCLILCHFFSVYTKHFIEKLRGSENIQFDILTTDERYEFDMEEDAIKTVYIYKTIEELQTKMNFIGSYDIIHIHFLSPFYGIVSKQIRQKANKVIVSIWGSDYYRTSEQDKVEQLSILEIADNINFGNEDTFLDFDNCYNKKFNKKLSICRFGLIQLEVIKSLEGKNKIELKREMSCSPDDIIITCGTNASLAQNHLAMIESILSIRTKLPANLLFIFPMTYGDANLILQIKDKLMHSGLRYKIYEEFLSEQENAKLRLISDVLIQAQTTDQLSGSMQEYLFAGNIIITGAWLPYKIFTDNGVCFLKVDTLEAIGEKLQFAIENMNALKTNCIDNKKLIWNMTSWENAICNWINVYYD